MPPPTAEPLATRVLLGPALRAQPDRRLVKLVRQGYETAFEEIVRRYRRPLDRFAAGIVGGRSEDVTQDAFSKALPALRGSENEIELRPWLYRIVRNTALNDLRDRPPSAEELGETIGGLSAAAEAERREEMAELMERLRALPEPQRAAIVMRELEGLSHEEIAAALGVSGGAARQTIHRARTALRDGLGMLIPLPLLRMLADHGAEAAGGAAAAGAGAAAGGGAALGGLGAGGALKVGAATVLVAGAVGTGVAIENSRHGGGDANASPAAASGTTSGGGADSSSEGSGSSGSGSDNSGPGSDDSGGRGEAGPGDDHGGRGDGERGDDRRGHHEGGHAGPGSGERGDDRGGSSGPGSRSGHGGPGPSGDGGSRSGSGHDGGGDDGGSGSSGSGDDSDGSGSGGSDDS